MPSDYGYFEETRLGQSYDINLLARLYPFIKNFRGLLVGSVILVVLISLLDLAVPYVTKSAIDRYIVPTGGSETDRQEGDGQPGQRFITVDLSDAQKSRRVARYPDLFVIENGTARIAYEDLGQLQKEDLAMFRRQDLLGLSSIAWLFMGVISFSFVFNFLQRLIMEYTGHRIMHQLRMGMFSHIQTLPVEFFNRNPVGRLVTRVTNDVQNMHELFTSFISFVFKDLFLLLGIAVMLLYLDWKLALASFTLLPPVIFAAAVFARKAREIFRILRIKIAEINTRFSETIAGIKIVQLFNHQDQNYRELAALNHENYLAGMRQIRVLGVFLPAIEVLGMTALAIIIYYGGSSVLGGDMSLGVLVAFISYLRMFFRPIRDLAEKYNILQNAMSSAERIFLILDTRPKRKNNVSAIAPDPADAIRIESIDFDRVDFSYIPGEAVLKNISFSIRAGETVAIVGPTGSGKTSLINLLMGFYDPQSGTIQINGHNLHDLAPASYRSAMALVMQEPFLFSESIRDNVFRSGNGIRPEQIQRILDSANCTRLIERLPEGLDTILGESGSSISSGERQLLSIARAFARNPQVILFDEATSYIDSQSEMQIQEALDRLMQSRTAVIVAHRLSTIRNADTILVLNHGRIIESGNHDQLMQRQGFYYGLQQVQQVGNWKLET